MTTPHSPEAVQALIYAVDECKKLAVANHPTFDKLLAARENLRPKPSMVPVLDEERPEWWTRFIEKGIVGLTPDRSWKDLVYLTSVPEKMEPWRMPTPIEFFTFIDGAKLQTSVSTNSYDNVLSIIKKMNFIKAMNKETP